MDREEMKIVEKSMRLVWVCYKMITSITLRKETGGMKQRACWAQLLQGPPWHKEGIFCGKKDSENIPYVC